MSVLHAILSVDTGLSAWIVAHRIAVLDPVMWTVSAVGRGGALFLAIGLGLATARRIEWSGALRLLLAIVLASLAADHVVKPIVNRQRPFERDPGIAVIGGQPHDPSFPSGHAANAFAGASMLSRLMPGAAWLWWLLAGLVALSRVYLGVHYPADVTAGAAIGLGCALLASWRGKRSG